MGTIIKPVDENNIAEVQKIAFKAWPETYNSILDPSFVQFELEREYSNNSLLDALKTQERFYLMLSTERGSIGFFALSPTKPNCVKLNKFYLDPIFKFQGLGKEMLKWVEKYAMEEFQATEIELMVNRQNSAKEFYQKNGFEIVREVDTPTNPQDPSFVRRDFLMKKTLK